MLSCRRQVSYPCVHTLDRTQRLRRSHRRRARAGGALHGAADADAARHTRSGRACRPSGCKWPRRCCRQFVADRKIAGAVAAVARRGKLVYLEPVGLQSLEIEGADDGALAVPHLLDDQGRDRGRGDDAGRREASFALTDPASKFLPEFDKVMVQEGGAGAPRHPSREITVQDLLLHTSGLSHRTSELYRRLQVRSRSIALPQFVVNITKAPLLEDPGTRFRYSEATTVLGRARRSGRRSRASTRS